MNRKTRVLAAGLLVSALILAVVLLNVNLGALSWFIPDDDPVRDVGLACVDSDPSRYTNVTYTPFESLEEREQDFLRPALEEGYVAITDDESSAINHTFIEYQNQTYLCSTSVS